MLRCRRPHSVPLALAAAAVLLAACASDEDKFATHMARGEEYFHQKRDREALIEYRNALQLDPQSAEVNQRIADVFRDNDSAHDAAFFYGEAYRLDPDRIDAVIAQMQMLIYSAERQSTWSGGVIETGLDQAKAILERVLERYAGEPTIHVARSHIALLENDVDLALTSIMTALQLAPEAPEVWLQLGAVRWARAQEQREDALFEQALAALARCDELAGGSVRARIERARVLKDWGPGHLAEAQIAHREAVALAREQGDFDVLLYAADVANQFAREGRFTPMRIWALREILAIPGCLQLSSVATPVGRLEIRRHCPDTPEEDSRVRIWDELAKLADSVDGSGEAVYRELLTKRPDDPIAHRYFADYLIGLGRTDDALAHLRGVVEGGLDEPDLREKLVRIHLDESDVAAARATYAAMAESHPKHPLTERAEARIALAERKGRRAVEILRRLATKSESFETLRLLSYAEYLMGNLAQATTAMDRALQITDSPRSASAFRARRDRIFGVLRAVRDEDLDLALSMAQEAVRADPSADVLDTLGWVHLQRGESWAAVEMLEDALKASPDSASIRYRLAVALYQAGKADRAQELLEIALASGTFPEADSARRLLGRLRLRTMVGDVRQILGDPTTIQ